MNERGFTMAELLVASAVLGVIMLGVFTVQQQGLSAYQVGTARVEVQQNARAALETMFNEIRSARQVTAMGAGCGTGPAPGGGATSISILDQNGVAVQYQRVGTNLQRNADVLIGGVESFQIWCYDFTWTPTATAGSVRSLHVRVRTQTELAVTATSGRNQHALMETRVRLRNL